MTKELTPFETDRQFFTSLVEVNVEALDRILADDFILIDVMGGSEITKSSNSNVRSVTRDELFPLSFPGES